MVSGLDNFKVGWVVDLTESTPCERAQNKVKKRKKSSFDLGLSHSMNSQDPEHRSENIKLS